MMTRFEVKDKKFETDPHPVKNGIENNLPVSPLQDVGFFLFRKERAESVSRYKTFNLSTFVRSFCFNKKDKN